MRPTVEPDLGNAGRPGEGEFILGLNLFHVLFRILAKSFGLLIWVENTLKIENMNVHLNKKPTRRLSTLQKLQVNMQHLLIELGIKSTYSS